MTSPRLHKRLRLLYAGTPDFAGPALRALIDSPHEILGVFTQPDRPAGRGRRLQASPVKQLAQQSGLPIYQPATLKDPELLTQMSAEQPDLMIVAAYGLMLPQAWLDLPRHGCWNLHASLLPRWRGAAPIQRALEAGDKTTGMTLMQMAKGLDTGDMLLKVETPIHADDTGGSLHDRLAALSADLLMRGIDQLCRDGALSGEAQDNAQANYAAKLSKAEAELDWSRPAAELERRIRAFNPFPVCWTHLHGERTRIWQAQLVACDHHQQPGSEISGDSNEYIIACGSQALRLTEVQPPGKRPMPTGDWLNARRHP